MIKPYHYCPRGHLWAVYRWLNIKKTSAVKVASFPTREEAREEAWRLNKYLETY